MKNEGDFVWGDSGDKISTELKSFWKEREPNNGKISYPWWNSRNNDNHAEEDCVEVAAGKMNDRSCKAKLKFVCQYKIN